MQKIFSKIYGKCITDKRIGRTSLQAFSEIINSVAKEAEEDCCQWEHTYSEDEGIFDTDCGHCFIFESGEVSENSFRYCPYCGKRIKVITDQQEDEE